MVLELATARQEAEKAEGEETEEFNVNHLT